MHSQDVAILGNDSRLNFIAHTVSKNGEYRCLEQVSRETVRDFNNTDTFSEMILEGPIYGIKGSQKSVLFIDIPSPNNCLDTRHTHVIEEMLDAQHEGLILYVIDAMRAVDPGNIYCLARIAEKLKQSLKLRVIFVLNKMDNIDPELDSIQDTVNDAKGYIESLGIVEPVIVPISAVVALRLKSVLRTGKISESGKYRIRMSLREFRGADMSLPQYAYLPGCGDPSECINNSVSRQTYPRSDLVAALHNTGLPLLEQLIEQAQIRLEYTYAPKVYFADNESDMHENVQVREPMNEKVQYAISYPEIAHPLMSIQSNLKVRYIRLINYLFQKFCPSNLPAKARIDRFIVDFLSGVERNLLSSETAGSGTESTQSETVFKMRFVFSMSPSYRVFLNPYQYLLLFDSIFLLAPDDSDLAMKLCSEIDAIFCNNGDAQLRELYQAMFSDAPTLPPAFRITAEQYKAWMQTRRYLASPSKRVICTATMSAGKSTLINALIGQELSFTKKAACTATVMEFLPAPVYHSKYNILAEGQHPLHVPADQVRCYTKGQEKACLVTGYFASELGKQPISIFDTPGINSSRNPVHKEITQKALLSGTQDVIVYVIPVAYYGAKDDDAHLRFINSKVSYKRILFVVNMMDTCDPEDDSIEEIVSDVRKYLNSIGFESPVVCPLSAKAGLLFKRALAGYDLSEDQIDELPALHAKYKNSWYDLSRYYSVSAKPEFDESTYCLPQISREQIYNSFIHTGLPQFEATLLEAIKEV